MPDTKSSDKKSVDLSVIVPLFNEAEAIEDCYLRTKRELFLLAVSYEIVFVDDGSSDLSWSILSNLKKTDPSLKIIKLTGNFGQTRALLAGIKYAQGEYIATMDIDLQIGPENLKLFYDKSCQGFDMVSASRKRRKDNFLYRQLPSFFLNLIISRRVGIQLRDWGASFVVVKKSVADRILDYGENARFLKQIAAKLSDKILEVDVDHYKRQAGRSRYGLLKLVTSSLDFLVNCRVEPSGNKKELFQISEVRL